MSQRVALVTGAGRGLGRAVAIALANRGVAVMATALEEDELRHLAADVGVSYVADTVETEGGRERVVAETEATLGPIDILVNNAGVSFGQLGEPKRPIWEADRGVWRTMMSVNLEAPFTLARLVSKGMIDRGWGRIVIVSSTSGQVGQPGAAAYCASKAGAIGLTRSIAQDVARHGVTCNAILPGYMRTKATEASAVWEADRDGLSVDQVWQRRAELYPAGRILDTVEVAEVIAFLAGDAASGVNGETITVALGGVL